jgi:hypothetical protein
LPVQPRDDAPPNSSPERIVIARKSQKPRTTQAQKEQQACAERMRRNSALLKQMRRVLTLVTHGHLTTQVLLHLAFRIAAAHHLKIDRTAGRMKDCLICWFGENVSVAEPSLNDLDFGTAQLGVRTQSDESSSDLFAVDDEEWSWTFG